MSHTLFIADLHLCNEEPVVTANFLHFLRRNAQYSDALYILGDLFESWIGDDDPNPLHADVAQALRQLKVPCFFIHGNRDFMLGQCFARTAGMTLLPEEQVLELYGKRLLIMHGDTLCTDDKSYQCYRRKIQQHWLQQFFLTLPLALRQCIARKMRNSSQQANSTKDTSIMDVNSQTVISTMRRKQTTYLIHGHTHRPAVHRLTINTEPAERLVLGAWNQQGSMIKVSHDEISLIFFPF